VPLRALHTFLMIASEVERPLVLVFCSPACVRLSSNGPDPRSNFSISSPLSWQVVPQRPALLRFKLNLPRCTKSCPPAPPLPEGYVVEPGPWRRRCPAGLK